MVGKLQANVTPRTPDDTKLVDREDEDHRVLQHPGVIVSDDRVENRAQLLGELLRDALQFLARHTHTRKSERTGQVLFQTNLMRLGAFVRQGANSEKEFLFAPYSVFTVESGEWSDNPDDDTPHIIHLRAAIDNRKESDDLPLAPWY